MVLVPRILAESAAFVGPRRDTAAERLRLAGRAECEPALWAQLAARSREGVLVADLAEPDAPLVYVNAAFERITGHSAREAIGKSLRCLWEGDRSQLEFAVLADAFHNREEAQITLPSYRKDGDLFLNELRIAPIFDRNRVATHYLGIMRDVTERTSGAPDSEQTATRDPVTGLFDRAGFQRQLEALNDDPDVGACLLAKADLTHFHEFNISFGYDAGDALLREIADRLRCRPGALIGRTAAHEFSIALRLPNGAAAKAIVEAIHEDLEAPYTLTMAMLNVRFVIGYTIGPRRHGAIALLREGAVALHQAKRSGGRLIEYDQATRAKLQTRGRLTTQLQQAIARQEFVLSFQPKVELASGALVGVQVFLRWRHPFFGDQGAVELFSLAHETGLILPISQWGLHNVAAFAARCNQGRATPLTIAFRITAMDLGRVDLLRRLPEVARQFGVEPAWLILELGEDVFVRGPAEITGILAQIHDLGFGVSIKNFGTHFASAEYLDRLRASEIKIDSGFVKGMLENRFQRVAVETVIRLGEALGVDVTAEGVDSAAVAEALRDLNCRIGQGAFLGEAMTEAAFLALANGAPTVSARGS